MLLKEKYVFSSISLGLGTLAKFYPVIFIPFLLIKRQYKAFLFCLVIITAGYLPFLLWDHTGIAMFSGLDTYAQEWASNGFIFKLFHSSLSLFSINSYLVSKLICAGIFAVLWFYVCFGKRTVIEKMFIAATSLFLLSPVGDPWYFCWVIPFLCIYRRYSLIALSFLLILHYFVFTRDFGMFNIGGFKIDNILLMQYVPFYILLLIEKRYGYVIYGKNHHV